MTEFRIGHPSIQSWFFADVDLFNSSTSKDLFHFQFNPSEVEVTYSSEWDIKDVTGIDVKTSTFKSRKPKIFKFDLFLNEWGSHDSRNKGSNFTRSVEDQIRWLDERMKPVELERELVDKKRPPPIIRPKILIFVWNKIEPVVITNMSVKRTHFRPLRSGALNRSQAGHTLPLSSQSSSFSFPGRSTGTPPLQSFLSRGLNNGAPQPGDAIRATVSITLQEYRKSNMPSTGFGFLQSFENLIRKSGFTRTADTFFGKQ